jgi:gamma-tubulin complex component 2
VERIEAAFRFASEELLRLLMREYRLLPRLRSLKHYFLLDQGDFLVHFMDIAGEELARPSAEISVPRLESLLELALRVSVASNDVHVDQLTCGLERHTIIKQLLTIYSVTDDAQEQVTLL